MSDHLHIILHASTDTGMTRDHNEDNFCIVRPENKTDDAEIEFENDQAILLAVADGMGGMEAGEVASQLAIDTIQKEANAIVNSPSSLPSIEKSLEQLIINAHERILAAAAVQLETKGMGTTLVLALLKSNKLYLSWSGDSRAYLFNADGVNHSRSYDLPKLKILTNDHSYVWDKVRSGELTSDEARTHEYSNIITQSLGDPLNAPRPETDVFDLKAGDKILLCSDGLNSMLPDELIEEILSQNESNDELVRHLIQAANEAGGHDNITVILADIKSAPEVIDALKTVSSRPLAITTKSGNKEEVQPKNSLPKSKQKSLTIFYILALILACSLLGWYVFKDINSKYKITASNTDLNIQDPARLGLAVTNETDSIYGTVKGIELDNSSGVPSGDSTISLQLKNLTIIQRKIDRYKDKPETVAVQNELSQILKDLNLAKRDVGWLDPINARISNINHDISNVEKKYATPQDVIHGTDQKSGKLILSGDTIYRKK